MRGGKYLAKKERRKPKPVWIISGIVSLVLLLISGLAGLQLSLLTDLLESQQAAAAWQGDSSMQFDQVSVFLSSGDVIDDNSISAFHRNVDTALQAAGLTEEGADGSGLYRDAWSGLTTLSVTADRVTTKVETVAIGGSFFLFHPLRLLSGSYLNNDDFMKDRVVLDSSLAWLLFGSTDVAGMDVAINGRSYQIAGVVRLEEDFATNAAHASNVPLMFMNIEALSDIKIDTYELVMADPISGYALKTVNDYFPVGSGTIIDNTGRYRLLKLFQVIGSYGKRSMSSQTLAYPYWENAARMTEDYCAACLLLILAAGLFPIVFMIIILVTLLRAACRQVKNFIMKTADSRIEDYKRNHYKGNG